MPPNGPQGFANMPYPPPPGWFPPGQAFPPGPGGPGPWGNQPFPPGPGGPGGPGGPPGPDVRGPPGAGPQDGKPVPAGPGADAQRSQAAPTEPKSLAQPPRASNNAPTPPVESKPSPEEVKTTAAQLEAGKAPTGPRAVPTGPKSNRVNPVVPLGSLTKPFQPAIAQQAQGGQATVETTVTTGPGSVQDATSAARAAVAVAMAQLGNPAGANAMDNLTNKVNEMRVKASRGGAAAPRGRGGQGRGGRPHPTKVEVPDSDFDFAQSNAKFNKDEVVREAIAGSPLTETPNGSVTATAEQTHPEEPNSA